MSVSPCPFVKFHVHDDNGNPATGWKIHAYESGTDIRHALYKDASGLIEHPNPLTLDSRGEPDGDGIFLEDGQAYKLVLKRPDGSTAWSQPYVMSGGNSSGGSTPALLPARSLLGNVSVSTAEAAAVAMESLLSESNNSVPSSRAVSDALEAALENVVHDSGAQTISGSLAVSGAIAGATVSVAGESVDERFVRKAGHAGMSLVGNLSGTTGPVSDITLETAIGEATPAGHVPTVGAVRDALTSFDTGLVSASFGDVPGYLSGKVGGSESVQVVLEDGSLLRLSVSASVLAEIANAAGVAKVYAEGSGGYLEDLMTAGAGISVLRNEAGKLEVANTAPETFKAQAHSASSLQGFLSSLCEAGTGLNIALSPDMNKLVFTATGSAVGGFYWKGTWSAEGTYNVNNAVWYFDHTGDQPISRLYIATTQNQGINPYDDAGIGTGACWSCMMAVDYMGDQFVMLDALDTRAGFFADKLKQGNYVTLTRQSDASGAWYVVDCVAPYQVKIGATTKTHANLGGIIEFSSAGGGSVAWDGAKVLITSLALGTTSTTAARGDQGATAYTHSQATGNPHGSTGDNVYTNLYVADASPTLPSGAGLPEAITSVLQTFRNNHKWEMANLLDKVTVAPQSVASYVSFAAMVTAFDLLYRYNSSVGTGRASVVASKNHNATAVARSSRYVMSFGDKGYVVETYSASAYGNGAIFRLLYGDGVGAQVDTFATETAVLSVDSSGALDALSLEQGGVAIDSKYFNKTTGDSITGPTVMAHSGTPLTAERSDSGTGSATIARLIHKTSATAADGLGTSLELALDVGGAEYVIGEIRAELVNGTNNSVVSIRPLNAGNLRNTMQVFTNYVVINGKINVTTPDSTSNDTSGATTAWSLGKPAFADTGSLGGTGSLDPVHNGVYRVTVDSITVTLLNSVTVGKMCYINYEFGCNSNGYDIAYANSRGQSCTKKIRPQYQGAALDTVTVICIKVTNGWIIIGADE